jgi:hypothetical protein
MYNNPKMCLAPLWLDILLLDRRLGAADHAFGQITMETSRKKSYALDTTQAYKERHNRLLTVM